MRFWRLPMRVLLSQNFFLLCLVLLSTASLTCTILPFGPPWLIWGFRPFHSSSRWFSEDLRRRQKKWRWLGRTMERWQGNNLLRHLRLGLWTLQRRFRDDPFRQHLHDPQSHQAPVCSHVRLFSRLRTILHNIHLGRRSTNNLCSIRLFLPLVQPVILPQWEGFFPVRWTQLSILQWLRRKKLAMAVLRAKRLLLREELRPQCDDLLPSTWHGERKRCLWSVLLRGPRP